MPPKLFAFDLDGTLLRSDKQLSEANRRALLEMVESGATIALASGRLPSSMRAYAEMVDFDVAMLTLNGAAVYTSKYVMDTPIYSATLDSHYGAALIAHAENREFALNFYHNGQLYAAPNPKSRRWLDYYFSQTSSPYNFIDSMSTMAHLHPSKIIFIGEADEINRQEEHFRALWGDKVYIVRSWEHYVEFLNPAANKGLAIEALAQALGIPLDQVAAFGDADNDIPMLTAVGHGIAMQNAWQSVKDAVPYVSPWTNDEDAIAREWARLKKL
jgi:Cof subfamily protein (haloacid dehalogenase superfamily)